MPYTIYQAKNRAKGIVKVQINVGKQEIFPGEERAVLIYDDLYKLTAGKDGLHLLQPLTKGIDEAMGMNLKRYFYYRLNKKGLFKTRKEIELLHEAPQQSW